MLQRLLDPWELEPALATNSRESEIMPQDRVLVVDDEIGVRSIVGALLERSGYSATIAGGAEEALKRLQEGPAYQLVISDIMMPGIDGLGLLDRICTDHPLHTCSGTPSLHRY